MFAYKPLSRILMVIVEVEKIPEMPAEQSPGASPFAANSSFVNEGSVFSLE